MDRVPTLSQSTIASQNIILPPNSLFHLFTNLASNQQQQQQHQQQQQQPTDASREEEKDYTNIMLEIDKGIRSSNLGEQVESTLFYAHLITYNPPPLVINSIIIKLADIFRTTNNNLVRYRILKVFQQCPREIQRISNLDDVLKRIHSVLNSNDPIARAIALRVFASMPILIADKLYIHHSIRACMQTHDVGEAEATFDVMDRLCEVSPVFSDSIIDKIYTIIQSVETPLHTKLKFTTLFRHMHHNHLISNQSKEMLIGLLELYPSVVFVGVILDTLTTLTLKHILYVNDHIKFLINYLINDPRIKVKLDSIQCLHRLAKKLPHSNFPLIDIFKVLNQTPYSQIKYQCLGLLLLLSTTWGNKMIDTIIPLSVDTTTTDSTSHQSGFQMLLEYSQHSNVLLSQVSIQIISNIFKEIDNIDRYQSQLNQFIDSICILLSNTKKQQSNDNNNNNNNSSKLTKSIIQLVHKYPGASIKITNTIINLFGLVSNNIIDKLYHCISIYCIYDKQSIQTHFKTLLEHLETLLKEDSCNLQRNDYQLFNSIFVIIFRSFDEQFDRIETITSQLISILENHHGDDNCNKLKSLYWSLYKIAQQAQVHGFHSFSKYIYSKLLTTVESECNYFWLKSLLEIASIECQISSPNTNRSLLLSSFNNIIISIKASSTQDRNLTFQERFIDLRERYIYSLLNMGLFINQIKTVSQPTSSSSSNRPINQQNGGSGGYIDNHLSALHQFENKIHSLLTLSKEFTSLYGLVVGRLVNTTNLVDEIDKQWCRTKSILLCYAISCKLVISIANHILLDRYSYYQQKQQLGHGQQLTFQLPPPILLPMDELSIIDSNNKNNNITISNGSGSGGASNEGVNQLQYHPVQQTIPLFQICQLIHSQFQQMKQEQKEKEKEDTTAENNTESSNSTNTTIFLIEVIDTLLSVPSNYPVFFFQ